MAYRLKQALRPARRITASVTILGSVARDVSYVSRCAERSIRSLRGYTTITSTKAPAGGPAGPASPAIRHTPQLSDSSGIPKRDRFRRRPHSSNGNNASKETAVDGRTERGMPQRFRNRSVAFVLPNQKAGQRAPAPETCHEKAHGLKDRITAEIRCVPMARADIGTPSAGQNTATSGSNRIVRFSSDSPRGVERPSDCNLEAGGAVRRCSLPHKRPRTPAEVVKVLLISSLNRKIHVRCDHILDQSNWLLHKSAPRAVKPSPTSGTTTPQS